MLSASVCPGENEEDANVNSENVLFLMYIYTALFYCNISTINLLRSHIVVFIKKNGRGKMFKQMHGQWCILLGMLLFIFAFSLKCTALVFEI